MLRTMAHRIHGFGLIARFAAIGVVVGLVVAGALAWFIDSRVTQLVLDEVAQDAIDQVNLGVTGRVAEADFEPPYTPERLADLDRRLAPVLEQVRGPRSSVIRLHIFARDGTVIFSDLASKRGDIVLPQSVPLLEGALAGSVGKKISDLDSPENVDLKARFGSAMEVYVPFSVNGRVVAAYEIYQELDRIRPVRPMVWTGVLGGFVVLLLSLLPVVRGAATQISRQQAERERLLQRAAEAEALREVARLKNEMMSIVSHELRTPLVSIIGFADILLMRERPEAERRRCLTIISQQGNRLIALINDFLDLQRMESGLDHVQAVPTDPRELLEHAVAVAGEDRERPIVLDLPEQLPRVLADPDRLQQVLANLISNARKYSPAGGEVRLSARRVESAVEVSVRDQGLGLPPEALPRLFEKFYRVGGDDRIGIRGTGLGLAICRRIIDLHEGRIWAESAGPGKGSCFRITLPLADGSMAARRRGVQAGQQAASGERDAPLARAVGMNPKSKPPRSAP